MLSEENIELINKQITKEVKSLEGFFTSDEDKPAILDRIAKLIALLSPQPSRQEILSELAAAIVAEHKTPTEPDFMDDISTIIANFRR